ncbi:hypothetical protein AWC38_SpisGene20063 [Stylophora pistillata]|uniref:Uncharacterized protein n=1 Tax=Stylophora pistillata TaxID=50429 RepID=A0A2B4RDK0_STYPI|nr:hypothetical protein AWC38_SpisGene20063 [Stylophora pistillata]
MAECATKSDLLVDIPAMDAHVATHTQVDPDVTDTRRFTEDFPSVTEDIVKSLKELGADAPSPDPEAAGQESERERNVTDDEKERQRREEQIKRLQHMSEEELEAHLYSVLKEAAEQRAQEEEAKMRIVKFLIDKIREVEETLAAVKLSVEVIEPRHIARRYSRRLRDEVPEKDGDVYSCFICLVPISVNLVQATVTPCCQQRIHRRCLTDHRNTSHYCGHCREPFPSRARREEPMDLNPNAENATDGQDLDVNLVDKGPIPSPLTPTHESMRQQAIQDLRALSEPGDLEAQIREVRLLGRILSFLLIPPTGMCQ